MVDKVNGKAQAGEFLGKQLDFYTVSTIALAGGSDAANEKLVDKIIETIAQNGQPIMLGGTALSTASLVNGTYTLKFAIEHTGSWGQSDADTKLVADKAQDAEAVLAAQINAIPGVTGAAVAIATEL